VTQELAFGSKAEFGAEPGTIPSVMEVELLSYMGAP
jgi:hypothetical protein